MQRRQRTTSYVVAADNRGFLLRHYRLPTTSFSLSRAVLCCIGPPTDIPGGFCRALNLVLDMSCFLGARSHALIVVWRGCSMWCIQTWPCWLSLPRMHPRWAGPYVPLSDLLLSWRRGPSGARDIQQATRLTWMLYAFASGQRRSRLRASTFLLMGLVSLTTLPRACRQTRTQSDDRSRACCFGLKNTARSF